MVPTILKDAEVYLDGNRFISRAKSFSLPSIEYVTETFEALATGGNIEIPLAGVTDNFEGSIQFAGTSADVFEVLDAGQAKLVEVLASQQGLNRETGAQEEVKHQVTVRALFTSFEMSDRERAQSDGPTATYTATYYKYSVGGETIFEFDKLAMIAKVRRGGQLVDLLQQTRMNLGIS